MELAVIKSGGKQYVVKPGDIINVDKIDAPQNKELSVKTLLIADKNGQEVKIGVPETKERVKIKILEHGRSKKISVIKFKRKTRYKRNLGHRQNYTKIQIIG